MSESIEAEAYPCVTQDGDRPTYPEGPSGASSIMVGLGTIVPRWKGSELSPLELKWYIRAETFPNASLAKDASKAFEQAAGQWNNISFGVQVSQTATKEAANFNLVYSKNPDDKPRLLARAFFPSQRNKDVIVFEYGLTLATKSNLKNVFLHELGHVFGLRHEFTLVKEGRSAKLFMEPNLVSVIAYYRWPAIQETDKEGIREFYKLYNKTDIDGSPITDYLPKLRGSS